MLRCSAPLIFLLVFLNNITRLCRLIAPQLKPLNSTAELLNGTATTIQSQENPVYYVQYAHARLCSVFEKARSAGIELEKPEAGPKEPDLSLLDTPEELRIMKMLASFPELVAGSAKALEPHRISYYLQELAGIDALESAASASCQALTCKPL